MKVKVRIALVVTLFLLAYMFCIWLLFPPTIPRRMPEPLTPEQKAHFEERFRFHGIWAAECDPEGCWFERKGRKCQL